jgi:hypothetical protein
MTVAELVTEEYNMLKNIYRCHGADPCPRVGIGVISIGESSFLLFVFGVSGSFWSLENLL